MKKIAILPCAGLGSRMGMSINQSKELLIDPATNEPLIQWHFNYCKKNDLIPRVVTRREKEDLIEYCHSQNVEVIVINPKGEWPATIDAGFEKTEWSENSDRYFVFFPDAKFTGNDFVRRANLLLDTQTYNDIIYGVNEVQDPSKWCVVDGSFVREKPKEFPQGNYLAVVMFAFRSHIYKPYFQRLNDDKFVPALNYNVVFIDKYVDLTRTGHLEKIDL